MLEIHNLQKIVDQRTVLQIDRLVLEAGEIGVVAGPIDSGKEILFDLVIGRLAPSAGTIRLAGKAPTKQSGIGHTMGVLFAEDSIYKNQTVRENLNFHSSLYGVPRQYIPEVLTWIGLADQANVLAGKLSSGLQRRLAFGQAILHHPVILFLFEPYARCDEATIELLAGLIRQLAKDGMAVLIYTEDATRFVSFADKLYVLQQGRLTSQVVTREDNAPSMPFKIPARVEEKVILINPADILYIEAEAGRTVLVLPDRRLPTQFTLNELEKRLSRGGFFRTHRAYLVNLQHIQEVIPYTRNSYTLRLDSAEGVEIPLSKSAAVELRELLGY